MAALTRRDLWQEALHLFQLGGTSLRSDLKACQAALEAAVRGQQWLPALILLEEMRASGLRVSLGTYSVLGSSIRTWQSAMWLLEVSREWHVVPPVELFSTALASVADRSGQ
ncbi:unnamed protein product, partial [Polarella glacialis]